MTRIGMGMGGSQGIRTRTMSRATGAQDWRQPAAAPRQSVDWADPKMATPQPPRQYKHPRRQVHELDDTPQLPERTIKVRGRPPATAYTREGAPIPFDQWVDVPISPGILKAIATGDLEEDKTGKPAQSAQAAQPERHRRREQPQPTQAE